MNVAVGSALEPTTRPPPHIGGGGPLHGQELLGGFPVQGNAWGRIDQLPRWGLGIGKVT
jgi:hypothetical protein